MGRNIVIDLDPKAMQQLKKTIMMKIKNLQSFNKKTNIENIIQKTDIKNLDLIGSHVNLSGLEVETANDSNRAFVLKNSQFKNSTLKKYDNIFIDCPPSLITYYNGISCLRRIVGAASNRILRIRGHYSTVKTIDRIKENLKLVLRSEVFC